MQGAYIKGSIFIPLLVCFSQNTMPQLRGCSVRADRSELMHGCCGGRSISPDHSCPGPAAAPGARSLPCCESWLLWNCSSRAANHSPARLDSQPGERLSGALPSQREQELAAAQLSLLQGPWEQHCHVRDLFLLSDTCVHMGTHVPERP